ncbi:hypothetical protein F2Q69_00006286 [Brassica cretica]|uniref:Uncharacterized protein n=1 Tax=Brassica cretica TaxID=69181 RepID=A0A8S9P1V1_BRACR|nr:hypothetical protein F2Q69_00006286 [Brassica cretica]
MEHATTGQIQNTQKVAHGAEKKRNDQQGVPQNFQGTFVFSQEQNWFVGQNQNQQEPQSNQQAVPDVGNGQPDELKGLGMMMQKLLQGQQVQAKELNQVTMDINTRMDNMFTELSTNYDTVRNHIRRIDVQIAQTAENVKSVMNPRVKHCNATELRCAKAKGKKPEQLFAETTLGA